MERSKALEHIFMAVRGGVYTQGDVDFASKVMDSAFRDTGVDWRLAVGLNKVCPECKNKVRMDGLTFISVDEGQGYVQTCPTCNGRGSVPNTPLPLAREGGEGGRQMKVICDHAEGCNDHGCPAMVAHEPFTNSCACGEVVCSANLTVKCIPVEPEKGKEEG